MAALTLKQLDAHRRAGRRPAGMVLLSLCGPIRDVGNPAIACTGHEHADDVACLVGLNVQIVFCKQVPEHVVDFLARIYAARPRSLSLHHHERDLTCQCITDGWRHSVLEWLPESPLQAMGI